MPFHGFTPPRPLRIFYLQAEIRYHYLRERMQQIGLPPELIAAARNNLIVTPKLRMLLDAEGSARVAEAIRAAFPDEPLDILCIDPIRNLFDGGPDGGRTIGSFENWAHVLGGVLEVAGIPGFLGNLEEMMESSDSEGAAWNAFIGAWWDRFGTAEVTAAEVYDIALFCDPPPPMSGANEQARKTSFGMSIGRMRDRVFRLGDLRVRLEKAGTYRRATKWQLKVTEEKRSSAAASSRRAPGLGTAGCASGPA